MTANVHKEWLPLFLSILFMLVMSSCDDRARCGDGKVEGTEECDGEDLRGQSCSDLFPAGQGTLSCREDCSWDISSCQYCGDGERQFGEQCDCGTDPQALPDHCSDVNGGAETNCTVECTYRSYCGDGIQDEYEECDCGRDPDNLPVRCDDVNGGSSSYCSIDCGAGDPFWSQLGEPCDPLVLRSCWVDDWGHALECIVFPEEGYPSTCMRECTSPEDCYWAWYCSTSLGGICQPDACGPTTGSSHTETNAFCTISTGTGRGWCAPVTPRAVATDPSTGICVEGNLDRGDTCTVFTYGYPIFPLGAVDRSAGACKRGLCRAAQGASTGICVQLCDWEAAYSVAFYGADPASEALPCPEGTNCFVESAIDPATGIRSGDLGVCLPIDATDLPYGVTSCSLVTGQLLSSPSETCLDAGFANGSCELATLDTGHVANGSLIGACTNGTAGATTLAVWALCNPISVIEVCPVGSLCERPDRYALSPVMAERCVPRCDTEHPAGTQQHCADLGAVPTSDGTPFCQTVSLLFPPGGPLDIEPTRLGLCGL